ncbi:uncharacterized protein LOC118790179 isoform X2 [Megalops cyprinoides]|uniref:uncharacterized protein LOC118790179 isoform X2 n=1 Tax=Megalops cyprinoides TaxID=118141 RepID=UPI001863D71F|nr:uncharacterized protein LOC118790179 isoform X2 [Megalops cyprinoides]
MAPVYLVSNCCLQLVTSRQVGSLARTLASAPALRLPVLLSTGAPIHQNAADPHKVTPTTKEGLLLVQQTLTCTLPQPETSHGLQDACAVEQSPQKVTDKWLMKDFTFQLFGGDPIFRSWGLPSRRQWFAMNKWILGASPVCSCGHVEVVANKCPVHEQQEVSSILEGELLAMGMWSLGLGAVGAAIAGIFLANTDMLLTKPQQARVEYLENADLKTLGEDEKSFKAKSLWESSGAVIMAVRRPG